MIKPVETPHRASTAASVRGTVADIAAKHDPNAFVASLARRDPTSLPFDPAAIPADAPVMLDTNVYLRRLQERLPHVIAAFIASRRVLHSAVACGELAISIGILDPTHSATARNRHMVLTMLGEIADADVVEPSAAAWTEAGLLAGILARTQYLVKPRKALTPEQACCQEGLRRKLINDALLFLSAHEQRAVLVTANIKDMDLLLRFKPDTHILLFA